MKHNHLKQLKVYRHLLKNMRHKQEMLL